VILKITLLILFLLILILISFFTLYILIPSITKVDRQEDPLVPLALSPIILPEEKKYVPSDKKAFVLCSCQKECNLERSMFNPEYTCVMAKTFFGSSLDCKYACLGLGDCVKICPQEAIKIENMTAIITKNCCGCGKCVEVCPQNIIDLIPTDTKRAVICHADDSEITSCSKYKSEENISWNDKKDFKIWEYCYRIIKRFK
jgi:NAD-dependent dihydropyrimidine dehydrogenase PreA subunit